jgi:cytochrome c oxidase subunit 2
MQPQRRRLVLAGLAAAFGAAALAQPKEKVIRVAAKKFEFTPAEIALVKGEPVVFELTSEDVTMGFYLPSYKTGTEIVPGKVTRFPFTPDREGTFEFICDVFCGEGHEDMGGKIVVSA